MRLMMWKTSPLLSLQRLKLQLLVRPREQDLRDRHLKRKRSRKRQEKNLKFRKSQKNLSVLRQMNDDQLFYYHKTEYFYRLQSKIILIRKGIEVLQQLNMGNMGSECLKMLQRSQMQEKRMLACLNLMKKVFVSQLITLALEGILVGYYLTNSFLIFKKQFESEEYVNPLCEICNANNFQLICKECRNILCCEDCFDQKKIEQCPKCCCTLKKEKIIKIFMN